jgi:hypothetical protein
MHPDIENKLERSKIELQHAGETCNEAIAVEEAIVSNESGNQSLENNISDFEGPFISKVSNVGEIDFPTYLPTTSMLRLFFREFLSTDTPEHFRKDLDPPDASIFSI